MQLNRETLTQAFRAMTTIRRFEERVQEEFSKGGIPGFVHLYAGQEASAVGVCSHLAAARPYRQHASRPRPQYRQGLRRHRHDGGVVRQAGRAVRRQGRFDAHRRSATQGMLGANGIVGGGPPLVVGAALTAKTLGTGSVAVSFTGDGGSNQGTTFEAMNLAVVLKLAGDLRVREQRLWRIHRRLLRRRQPRHRRPRRRFRPAGGEGQRRRFLRGARGCRRGDRPRPQRRRSRARSRSIPAASTATTPATRSSIAARTR